MHDGKRAETSTAFSRLEAGDKYDPKAPKLAGYPVGVFPYCVVVDARRWLAAHGTLLDMVPVLERQVRLTEMGRKPASPLTAREWLQPKCLNSPLPCLISCQKTPFQRDFCCHCKNHNILHVIDLR